VLAALQPWAAPGSLINHLGDVSGPEEVAAAYPPATLERLREVKRTVDPAGVFSFGHAF
jgi:FAD/FMN-containing dehydrogenase